MAIAGRTAVSEPDDFQENVEPPKRRFHVLRGLLALGPALLFIGLLWFGLARSDSKAVPGQEAPNFELPLLSGDGTISDEDLRGKPVVINFWASWCVPCREEAPRLERAWRAYRKYDVVFLGVNVRDSDVSARRFVRDFNLTYPQIRTADSRIEQLFGLTGLPETFFIDGRWRFVTAFSGGPQDFGGVQYLGSIPEDVLFENLDILVRRTDSSN